VHSNSRPACSAWLLVFGSNVTLRDDPSQGLLRMTFPLERRSVILRNAAGRHVSKGALPSTHISPSIHILLTFSNARMEFRSALQFKVALFCVAVAVRKQRHPSRRPFAGSPQDDSRLERRSVILRNAAGRHVSKGDPTNHTLPKHPKQKSRLPIHGKAARVRRVSEG